jgi:sarcosine oxidase subunit beta
MRVIVVGAGILGLSIAYNLAKCGADVRVIESKYPGSGVSVRAIGAVHSQWENAHDIKLALQNRETLADLSSELNFNIPFRRDGYLMLAMDANALDNVERCVELQSSLGLDVTMLTPEELEAKYPYIETGSVRGGAFSKGDGSVHPFSVVYGYWNGLEHRGGKLIKGTTVKGVQLRENEISGVETDQGTYEADAYVLAAGSGTNEILRAVGLQVSTHLVKHEMLATEPLRFFLQPMIQIWPERAYVSQSLRGEVLCQMPRNGEQSPRDTSSTLNFLRLASTELIGLIPALREVKVLRPWGGLVETTTDHEPIIGRSKYDNLWLAFADSGKGVMMAHAIGKLVAKEILSEETDPNLNAYLPTRFRSPTNSSAA